MDSDNLSFIDNVKEMASEYASALKKTQDGSSKNQSRGGSKNTYRYEAAQSGGESRHGDAYDWHVRKIYGKCFYEQPSSEPDKNPRLFYQRRRFDSAPEQNTSPNYGDIQAKDQKTREDPKEKISYESSVPDSPAPKEDFAREHGKSHNYGLGTLENHGFHVSKREKMPNGHMKLQNNVKYSAANTLPDAIRAAINRAAAVTDAPRGTESRPEFLDKPEATGDGYENPETGYYIDQEIDDPAYESQLQPFGTGLRNPDYQTLDKTRNLTADDLYEMPNNNPEERKRIYIIPMSDQNGSYAFPEGAGGPPSGDSGIQPRYYSPTGTATGSVDENQDALKERAKSRREDQEPESSSDYYTTAAAPLAYDAQLKLPDDTAFLRDAQYEAVTNDKTGKRELINVNFEAMGQRDDLSFFENAEDLYLQTPDGEITRSGFAEAFIVNNLRNICGMLADQISILTRMSKSDPSANRQNTIDGLTEKKRRALSTAEDLGRSVRENDIAVTMREITGGSYNSLQNILAGLQNTLSQNLEMLLASSYAVSYRAGILKILDSDKGSDVLISGLKN